VLQTPVKSKSCYKKAFTLLTNCQKSKYNYKIEIESQNAKIQKYKNTKIQRIQIVKHSTHTHNHTHTKSSPRNSKLPKKTEHNDFVAVNSG